MYCHIILHILRGAMPQKHDCTVGSRWMFWEASIEGWGRRLIVWQNTNLH